MCIRSYVCISSSFLLSWYPLCTAAGWLSNMPSNNGVCVSFICQDQPEAIAVVMECGSHVNEASCCAVFSSEVDVVFLRGSSDGATHILTFGGVVPTECRSAALARDEVASTIKKCVCGTSQDLFILTYCEAFHC